MAGEPGVLGRKRSFPKAASYFLLKIQSRHVLEFDSVQNAKKVEFSEHYIFSGEVIPYALNRGRHYNQGKAS